MVRKIAHLVIEGDEAQTADMHASHWLAKANELSERGKDAEHLYDKAQQWLDRANELRGWT